MASWRVGILQVFFLAALVVHLCQSQLAWSSWVLYDDFNDGSIDTSKWDYAGSKIRETDGWFGWPVLDYKENPQRLEQRIPSCGFKTYVFIGGTGGEAGEFYFLLMNAIGNPAITTGFVRKDTAHPYGISATGYALSYNIGWPWMDSSGWYLVEIYQEGVDIVYYATPPGGSRTLLARAAGQRIPPNSYFLVYQSNVSNRATAWQMDYFYTFPPAPNEPSNLAVTLALFDRIDLSWQDNSSDEDGFRIERKTEAGGSWSQIATTSTNVTTYADRGLLCNTTYFYRVRSYNSLGDSAYSNESSATTLDVPPTSLVGHIPPISAVSACGDIATTVATVHEDNSVRLWKATDGKMVRRFLIEDGPLRCVALSHDGKLLLTGGNDHKARSRRTGDGQIIGVFTGHSAAVNSVAFSSGAARVLTASDDGTVILWDASSGAVLMNFFGHGGAAVNDAEFSPDEKYVLTGGDDRTARLWDATNGLLIRTFSGHTYPVRSVAFSRDGQRIVTGSDFGAAKIWNIGGGPEIHTFSGHTSPVVSVAFSPDGSQVMTTGDKTIKIWSAADGSLLRRISGHTDKVTGAVVSDDGTRIITASKDGTARMWLGFTQGKSLRGDKVIIVAGGGDFTGNGIIEQTKALADQTYLACLIRGYHRDEIQYLSAFNDWRTHDATGDGQPDVSAQATRADLWTAIDTWSSGTARLFLYLVDHGSHPTGGTWYFRLNQNDYLNARDLDRHLDDLQARTPGSVVILIVDCCFAGGFVQQCTATSGTYRVVIAATTPADVVGFLPPVGQESFSSIFFSYATLGNTIENCFDWTRMAFQAIPRGWGQVPWRDDDNDGDSDKWDGAPNGLAARHVLGRYPAFGLNAPTIVDAAATQTITLGQTATLWANLDEAVAAKEVWALLISEGATFAPDQPVTTLPRINLVQRGGPGRWEAVLSGGLQPVGQLSVVYFAMSEDALKTRLLATPVARGLTVQSGGYDVRFDKASSVVSEGAGSVNLVLRLSKAASWPVTVYCSASGSATPGSDYGALPATVTFSAAQTTKTISVKIINDTMDEPDETVVVTLAGATGAVLGAIKTHTLTIRDDDPTPTLGFAQPTGQLPESIGLAQIAVRLWAASGKTVKVNYATAAITATAGKDFLTTSGLLTFTAGQTAATVKVRILADQIEEGPETLRVTLSNPQNATLATSTYTLTIEGKTAIRRWPLYH